MTVLVEKTSNIVQCPSNAKDIMQQMEPVSQLAVEFRIIVYVIQTN